MSPVAEKPSASTVPAPLKPGWTLPNSITVARLIGAAALFAVLAFAQTSADAEWIASAERGVRTLEFTAFLLFVLAAATDALDGWLARRYGWVSAFGRVADPFVDKILVCGTLVFLCANPMTSVYIPAWFVVVLLGREFLVTGLRGYVESRGIAFPAEGLGKLKMILQCILIGGVLFRFATELRPHLVDEGWTGLPIAISFWATLALTVISGVQYVYRARKVLFE